MDSVSRSNVDVCDTEDSVLDTPVVANFDDLLKEIRLELNNCVDVKRILALMSAYVSDPKEWSRYAKFEQQTYTRNLVDEEDGKYNLILLAWGEGQGSKIHDHAASHCFMKVLSGSLLEVRYFWPSEGVKQMKIKSEIELKTNNIAHINDTMSLHLMKNPSNTTTAVSLHLYCPPFKSVSLFDPSTSQITKAKMTFHSKFGKRTNTGTSSEELKNEN